MSSSGGGFGSILTGGIQDISGILPLLGTEQCSDQVSSALTRGYLYAAATPMSIFGSLGVVTAGFKTLVACISFGKFEGAVILGNMGFEPQGENLSLIMVEGKNAKRYIIETRIDELIKELHIDRNRITGVSHKSTAWNVKMMAMTAFLCAFSITPYIYLNLGNKSTTWAYPVLRATGGFITATLIQLLIQQRITTLSNRYLKRPVDTKNHHTWPLLFLLLIGLLASLVGYVGCFSVVQNSTLNFGAFSWLCLEAGLSVMRLVIWACNPPEDDAPPLKITLELDRYKDRFLPTCNKDNKEILRCKVLPLTRAPDFLKIITSFAGLIEPFSNPDLSLYYTLTRPVENAELGEWTLYITVFDHKERTTRVYTREGRDNKMDTFYSTKSDAPRVDVGHFLLEVEIDAKIIDFKGDPIFSDGNLDSLRNHHQSILEHIQHRLGASDVTNPKYTIENSWTMIAENNIRSSNGADWNTAVEEGKKKEQNEKSLLICDYFMHSSIERARRWLDEKRVKWIARRMEMITKETKERFEGKMGAEYRVNEKTVDKPATKSAEEIDQLLCRERCMMELLLLYEVNKWEQLFWDKLQAFLHRNQIGGRVKERLTREWRADCWKRLNPQMHAAEKRLAGLDIITHNYWFQNKDWVLKNLREHWASSISKFVDENPNSILLSKKEILGPHASLSEIRLRMEKEIEDIEFRLKCGSESGRFDQFWDDDTLLKCRYSRSKWLYLKEKYPPLENVEKIYSHALKGNENIIHITFSEYDSDSYVNQFQATIRDLPRVTSISRDSFKPLPAIHRDPHHPLFIKSTNNDLITFAENIRPNLTDLFSTYIFTDAENSDMDYNLDGLGINARVLISFVAPKSGRLKLRLEHSGEEDGPLEVTLGSTTIRLNPSSKSSLTIDDITLYPIPGPSKSDHLSFKPGIRNDIAIQFRGTVKGHSHFLHDIELLDEAGGCWSGGSEKSIDT